MFVQVLHKHLITAYTGSVVDYLYDVDRDLSEVDDLDRDLSEIDTLDCDMSEIDDLDRDLSEIDYLDRASIGDR